MIRRDPLKMSLQLKSNNATILKIDFKISQKQSNLGGWLVLDYVSLGVLSLVMVSSIGVWSGYIWLVADLQNFLDLPAMIFRDLLKMNLQLKSTNLTILKIYFKISKTTQPWWLASDRLGKFRSTKPSFG